MKKIIIVGCPGAGKSTVAKQLADILHLPLIHLDKYYWKPGWVRPSNTEWRGLLENLCLQPEWIMDGNYGSSLDIRLAQADTLIHLDFSTTLCLYRAIKRTLGGLGRDRSGELPEGCPDRLDMSFFKFVWGYRRTSRQKDMERMAGFKGTVHRFSSPSEVNELLKSL